MPAYEAPTGFRYWNLKNGNKISYLELATSAISDSTPILYIHGGPGACITPKVIEMFRKISTFGYKVYLYDQTGAGNSSRPDRIQDYSVENHCKDLEEIIDKIASPKVYVIAQSWGSLLLTNYLTKHHDKIEKVIFTGPGSILPVDRTLRNIKAPDSLRLQQPIVTNNDGNRKMNSWRSTFVCWMATKLGIRVATDKEMDGFFYALNNELNKSTYCDTSKAKPTAPGGGYYAHIMTINSFNLVPDKKKELRNSTFPILIMRGQCDNQPWGFTAEYLDLFPNIQLTIIPDSGHSISSEQPELYLKTILDFLKN